MMAYQLSNTQSHRLSAAGLTNIAHYYAKEGAYSYLGLNYTNCSYASYISPVPCTMGPPSQPLFLSSNMKYAHRNVLFLPAQPPLLYQTHTSLITGSRMPPLLGKDQDNILSLHSSSITQDTINNVNNNSSLKDDAAIKTSLGKTESSAHNANALHSGEAEWLKQIGNKRKLELTVQLHENKNELQSTLTSALDKTSLDLVVTSQPSTYKIDSVAPTEKIECNPEEILNKKLRLRRQKRICSFNGCTHLSRGRTGKCISHGGGKRCNFVGCDSGAEGRGEITYCKRHGGGRRCIIPSCPKAARGSTKFCVAHGGGRRCKYHTCTKSAAGTTHYCITHGGGKRCNIDGCQKSAQGSTTLCKAHGGGKRCIIESCIRSAEGKSSCCVRHGGGRRCEVKACDKAAQSGPVKRCKRHGGGRRCQIEKCPKTAQGTTKFCKAHGGGQRCTFPNCGKSARGKLFCIGHGGGKRCQFQGCNKSAVGKTKACIAHGGGRRCNFKDCKTSARGSSDFCRAHTTIISKSTSPVKTGSSKIVNQATGT